MVWLVVIGISILVLVGLLIYFSVFCNLKPWDESEDWLPDDDER